jgi:hypothetical protein
MVRGRKRTPLMARFLRHVDITDACWLWTGTKNGAGYGTIGLGRAIEGKGFTHRVAWTLFRGPIPDGMFVCHKCDIKTCVNPNHLFLGTQYDNMRDAVNKGRMLKGRKWHERDRDICQGERHGMAKLSLLQVVEIRERFSQDNVTKADLAREFCVCHGTIRNIVSRRSWSHI